MEKQIVKLESLLTVVSPQQHVRILDDENLGSGLAENVDEITLFKGPAVKAFREYAGHGVTVKHISPELEREVAEAKPRYVMHVYIYRDSKR